jgi:hypothetical protein
MSEVKESVSVHLRLGDIEVGADERNQDRVEDVIDQLVKQFRTLL